MKTSDAPWSYRQAGRFVAALALVALLVLGSGWLAAAQAPQPPRELTAVRSSQFGLAPTTGKTGKELGSDEQPAAPPSHIYLPLAVRNYDPDVLIDEGFEGGTLPPAGWELIRTDPDFTWKLWTSEDEKPPAIPGPHEGSYSVACYPDIDDQNEVLLSPPFQSETAQLQFYSFGDDSWWFDSRLNVWLVIGAWDGVDDTLIHTANEDWIVDPNHYYIWSPSFVELTPYLPAGTPARLGFQYSAKQDGDLIGLDAIRVTRD